MLPLGLVATAGRASTAADAAEVERFAVTAADADIDEDVGSLFLVFNEGSRTGAVLKTIDDDIREQKK